MSEPTITTQSASTVEVPPAPADTHPVTIEITVKLQAVAIREADGRYSVAVPAIPGCTTMGDDLDDARKNATEAAEGCLEVAYDRNREEAIRNMTE